MSIINHPNVMHVSIHFTVTIVIHKLFVPYKIKKIVLIIDIFVLSYSVLYGIFDQFIYLHEK